ncbi:TIGR03086 family metal-binding protein [Gordonia sp. (in: high G+C Gram-positive bacteria)]|uniref:TIGR03086 family metal-binding protein n=1 Tax=Gordonia sp. (in: high G+C Gram-positive bacteria) TaxID=84139 RepID=UPI0035298C88
MAWDSLQMYSNGLDFFGEVVDAVPADGWGRPSPCAGWTALDVLGHVGAATAMGAAILAGEPVEFTRVDPPGGAVTGDPGTWWAQVEAAARDAATSVDDLDRVVNSPRGPRTIEEGLSFPAADLFLHGWDIAAATGRRVEIPGEAVDFIHGMFKDMPAEIYRGPGIFGPEVHAGHGASATDKLIAFTGRDPHFGS